MSYISESHSEDGHKSESHSEDGRKSENNTQLNNNTIRKKQDFERFLTVKQFLLEDAEEALKSKVPDEINFSRSILSKAVGDLESTLDHTLEILVNDRGIDFSYLKQWRDNQRQFINDFKELIRKMQVELQSFDKQNGLNKKSNIMENDFHENRSLDVVIPERSQIQVTRKPIENAESSNPDVEALVKDMNKLQHQMKQLSMNGIQSSPVQSNIKPTAVKLQRYTISPFKGDYLDWIRFWNQFKIEVDQSGLAEISKFNYLLELVKGKPLRDITGLPHTEAGYITAKEILQEKYGKSIKVKRAVMKELEDLESIPHSSNNKIERCLIFYDQFSKTVRTLDTMGGLGSAEGYVNSIMDKREKL